jgi:hypothetical protein
VLLMSNKDISSSNPNNHDTIEIDMSFICGQRRRRVLVCGPVLFVRRVLIARRRPALFASSLRVEGALRG